MPSKIELKVGTSDFLDYPDAYFDVVWFGFCLYLVDRSSLMKSVAEANRVLKNGGYLVITDFDPQLPCKRKYHHHAGLYSYKMNYSALFLANPEYALVSKQSYSHEGSSFHDDPNERVASWLLAKSSTYAYQEQN